MPGATRIAPRSGRVLALLSGLAPLVLAVAAQAASPLSATGTVTGSPAAGQTVQVRVDVRHTSGWQQISEVEIDLSLRGKPLEQLVIDPTHDSAVMQGVAGPVALGQEARFAGVFFRVDPAEIGLTAKGQRLTLSIPITFRNAPPIGARLTLQARGFDVTQTKPLALTAPVNEKSGFSWGTLGAAIAAALFVGGFLGSLVASRRRPVARPSVYATVQRRLEQDRAGK